MKSKKKKAVQEGKTSLLKNSKKYVTGKGALCAGGRVFLVCVLCFLLLEKGFFFLKV